MTRFNVWRNRARLTLEALLQAGRAQLLLEACDEQFGLEVLLQVERRESLAGEPVVGLLGAIEAVLAPPAIGRLLQFRVGDGQPGRAGPVEEQLARQGLGRQRRQP